MDSALEPSEGMWSYQHLDVGQVILILDFWPPEPKIMHLWHFRLPCLHDYYNCFFVFNNRHKKRMQFWYQTTDKLLRTQDY